VDKRGWRGRWGWLGINRTSTSEGLESLYIYTLINYKKKHRGKICKMSVGPNAKYFAFRITKRSIFCVSGTYVRLCVIQSGRSLIGGGGAVSKTDEV